LTRSNHMPCGVEGAPRPTEQKRTTISRSG
jgi:hypothetical protein